MAWKELAPPAARAVSVAFAKSQARVLSTTEDTLVGLYIDAAIRTIETETRRPLIKRQFLLVLDDFPWSTDTIELPIAPLVSLDSIQYLDMGSGSLTAWSNTNYDVDGVREPGRIRLKFGLVWPFIFPRALNAVQITFTAGYGTVSDDAAIPEPLRLAVMFLAAHWYDKREPVTQGAAVMELPKTFDYLKDTYKLVDI